MGHCACAASQSFDGLEVNITCSQDHFEIQDNCGGINPEIAPRLRLSFWKTSKCRTGAAFSGSIWGRNEEGSLQDGETILGDVYFPKA